MKRFTILAAAIFSLQSFGQNQINFKTSQEVSFSNSEINLIYEEFLKNQEETFKKANFESFKLNETIWNRPFGEKHYCLTPDVKNIDDFLSRISENTGGFQFVEIGITNSSVKLLKKVNINIPNYLLNSVICYLPAIDINFLIENGIELKELTNYGNQMHMFSKTKTDNLPKALIWSEGFESNAVPGNNYNAVNGATNCGWKDVSCYSNSGDWSVWCAGNGAACNNCLEDYVNDMETNFAPTNYLNVSGYNDIFFNYSIDLDLNNSGTNDEFLRFEDLGSGTWSLAFSANSGNSIDGQLWQNLSVNYTGQSFNNYAFNFGFTSNFTGTSFGVYLDDLQLTGNSTANLNEIAINQLFQIYPNPSNGVFNLEILKNNNNPIYLSLFNLSGQLVYSEQFELNNNQIKTIDLNKLEKGVYSIQLKSEEGIINKKLVIE